MALAGTIGIVVAIIIIAAVAIGLTSCGEERTEVLKPGQQIDVTIQEGSTGTDIAQTLFDNQVIATKGEFTKRVKDRGVGGQLKPGTYTFVGGMTVDEVIDALVRGPIFTGSKLTVPEGSRLTEIADGVQRATNGRISAEAFIAATSDASVYADQYPFLKEAGKNSLEGFLYPKTYDIQTVHSPQDIAKMMLDEYAVETAKLDYSFPESEGLNHYELLILASIVEKESTPSTMALVAGVLYNRLDNFDEPNYGFLQVDATTAYEIGHEPTGDDVHTETPYSTYTNKGLVPTPICSPSFECLQATCDPERSNYFFFYFYNDENGYIQYQFSETMEEHEQAIYDHP